MANDIAAKLEMLMATKSAIRSAIEAKGVSVSDDDTFRSYAEKIGGISSGGGGGGAGAPAPIFEKSVIFYDYDGRVVAAYSLEEAQALTALPAPPEHVRLVFDGWNHTLAEVNACNHPMSVGAIFHTASGKLETDVLVLGDGFTVKRATATGVVDWGDGTEPSDSAAHTYAKAGRYRCVYTISGAPIYTSYYGRPEHSTCIVSVFLPLNGISDYAFYNRFTPKAVTIPFGVTVLKVSAFSDCFALHSVSIPRSVTSIQGYVFRNCYSLQYVSIPNTLTSIGNSAFYQCSSLQQITLPDSLTSIGISAFYQCYSLQQITLPDSLTSIGDSAFYSCTSLSQITIPDGVTSIGNSAFYRCYSLQQITLSDSLTSIGNSAFSSCSKLTAITILAETPPTLSSTNAIPSAVQHIYVPAASVDDYKEATNWASFASKIEAIPEND